MIDRRCSRRTVIAHLGKVALASVFMLPVLECSGRSGNKSGKTTQPLTLDVQQPEYRALASDGGAVKVANPFGGKPIIVIRISETEIGAFSSRCPHLGCEVSLPEAGVLSCPCHGSTFSESGRVTHGPSIKDLYRYAATMNGTAITISNERAA